MAPGKGETATAEPAVRDGNELLVSATVWVDGGEPQEFGPTGSPPHPGIRWYDVASAATPEALLTLLGRACPGLEREMLDDLLTPDDIPENRRWHEGTIRLASTFAVYPAVANRSDWARKVEPSANAVYQEVELLAGTDWLITVWHDAQRYCGKTADLDLGVPVGKGEVFDAAVKRWLKAGGGNAGDLGVLVLHELALTYAPAHRHFRAALEEWEMGLYGSEGESAAVAIDPEQDRELQQLWEARARLRDWLSPLNVIGLNEDLDKAWLPATDHDEVKAVDKRVDNALASLLQLGETLRSSFHLVYLQKSEAQREHRERVQRIVEVLAPVFIVPTIIVGFYGANTWVPGQHRIWGFLVMVAAILVLTCVTGAVLWSMSRRRRNEQRARRAVGA